LPVALTVKLAALPEHTDCGAGSAVMAGSEKTVNVPVVRLQPVVESVNVNVAVPGLTVVMLPALSIVATAGLLLTQVPPEVGVNCVVLPIQTDDAPPKSGLAFTVTFAETELLHPALVTVYIIVAVPGARPVTTPEPFTEANNGVAELQTPPGVASAKVVVPVTQVESVPVMGCTDGSGVIVKFDALVAVPPGAVTEIGPVVAPDGTVAVICVALTTVKAAERPLKLTAVAPVKLVPVMVTVGVVPAHALVGVKFVMVGPSV
jgi:hypothetical protein